MKTVYNTHKNVCKKPLFFEILKHIRITAAGTLYFSGLPPPDFSKIHPELAVNMAEFFQFEGVPL